MMVMLKGELTKIKTMSFDVQGETMKFDYKVKGDKLILINPDKDDEKLN